jgi:hypothetical protein
VGFGLNCWAGKYVLSGAGPKRREVRPKSYAPTRPALLIIALTQARRLKARVERFENPRVQRSAPGFGARAGGCEMVSCTQPRPVNGGAERESKKPPRPCR